MNHLTAEDERVLRLLWFHDGPLSISFMSTTQEVMDGLKRRGLAHLGPRGMWYRTQFGMNAVAGLHRRDLRQFAKAKAAAE